MSAKAAGYQYTLVVGPDSPDRAWLESVLMRGGLEVAACSEAELLAMPDVVAPQLVILDDSGSREERMASFANLLAHSPLTGVPVVVLSYDADIESFSTAITRGAAAYLVKPVAAEEIVAVAHKISGWLRSNDRTEKRRRQRRPLHPARRRGGHGRGGKLPRADHRRERQRLPHRAEAPAGEGPTPSASPSTAWRAPPTSRSRPRCAGSASLTTAPRWRA